MSSPRSRSVARALARPPRAVASSLLVLGALATPAAAQTTTPASRADSTAAVVVLPFDFAAPLPEPRRAPPRPPLMRPGLGVWPIGAPMVHRAARPSAPPPRADAATDASTDDVYSAIGAGVADLLVERLVADGGFRVVDRRWLAAHPAAASPDSLGGGRTSRDTASAARPRYTIAGSVTRFDVQDESGLGGLGRLVGFGGFGLRRPTTTVTLVARLVDGRTGEVVATARGEGTSHRGSGLTIGGIAHGGGGIFSVGSKSFRESALGEATARAVVDLAHQIAEHRSRLAERD